MANRWLPSVATLSSLSMALLMMVPAHAVELGNLSLQSASGQPLMATVELSDTEGLSASDINIQVASADDFFRFNLERIGALDTLQIQVDFSGDTPVLRISSPVTINEPFISLILDTRWPAGRVLTEYTLRLEFPAFSASSAGRAPVAPIRSEQVPAGQPAEQTASSAPAVAVPETAAPTPATVTNAPVGSQTVDTQSAAAQPSPPDSSALSAGTTQQTDAGQTAAAVSNASTITVNAGDTLWELAQRVRPDSSVSVQQTMLALQRLNPEAFIGGNINRIRRGEILQVPELTQIRELASAEAVSEVSRQNQQLASASGTPAQPVTNAPSSAPAGAGAQGELRVVTVADDSDSQQADASAAGNQTTQRSEQIESLEDRISLGEEDLARLDAQNSELNARLALLQQQISSAQEIIRLRDLELAQLQQELASESDAASSEEVPPPVITMAPDAGPLQRAMHVLTSNTWAMLGAASVLVLLLVLLMVRRNRAAAESKAQASARENDGMSLGSEDDELLFSGVAEAAAESAAASANATSNAEPDEELPPRSEATAFYLPVEESADDDSAPEADKKIYNNKIEEEFEKSINTPEGDESELLPLDTDLSEPELDKNWQRQEPEPETDSPTLDNRFELDDSVADSSDNMDFEEQESGTHNELSGDDTGADLDWPDDDKTTRAGDEFDISLTDDETEATDTGPVPPATKPSSAYPMSDDFDDLAFLPSDDDFTDQAELEDEEDFDFLLDSDEAATKLDLARAYIDMGDSHGAREILQEVLSEGTEVQRQEAQELLGRL